MTEHFQQIITRFAPSPTGDPHIGSLRSALYPWLFARQQKGKFILRIDDTDRSRFQAESDQAILEMLEWADIDYDETFRQSQRREIHQQHAEQLVKNGQAYYCFCSSARLEEMRRQQTMNKAVPKYDLTCREIPAAVVAKRRADGELAVIRLKIPQAGETIVDDIIRSRAVFANSELDDFVLLKSDGYPTYHLASVVDDNEYNVTHIIRSEEWFPSLPKHVLLYQAFGWKLPKFAHLPLILAPDKSKLSKRHGATGVLELRKLGYLPEALLNYVLLLGWHPKQASEQEIFSREEMLEQFRLEDVRKGGAIFDYQKLDWLNGLYIRQTPTEKLAELIRPYLDSHAELGSATRSQNEFGMTVNGVSLQKAIELEKERVAKLSELPEALKFIFSDIDYETEVLIWKKSDKDKTINRLIKLIELISELKVSAWSKNALESRIKSVIESEGLGTGETLWPLRVALSGQKNSPGPFEIAEVLGKEKTLARLAKAVKKLSDK